MYREHWGLTHKPFHDLTGADFLYRHDVFQSALLKLRYVLDNRLGAAVLTGNAGCGKTLLLRRLALELPAEYGPVVRFAIPQLSSRELLAYLAAELDDDESGVASIAGNADVALRRLQHSLREHCRRKKHPVLVLDECHSNHNPAIIDAVRWLLGLRDPVICDFSVILAGEPSMLPRLMRDKTLVGRIPINAALSPLTSAESTDYIVHRLRAAGATRELFEPAATTRVHELTGGVPLWINHLCELSLLVGFADRSVTLTAEQVETVAEELPVLATPPLAA